MIFLYAISRFQFCYEIYFRSLKMSSICDSYTRSFIAYSIFAIGFCLFILGSQWANRNKQHIIFYFTDVNFAKCLKIGVLTCVFTHIR